MFLLKNTQLTAQFPHLSSALAKTLGLMETSAEISKLIIAGQKAHLKAFDDGGIIGKVFRR